MNSYLITGASICGATNMTESDVAVEDNMIVAIGDLRKQYKHLPVFEFNASDKLLPGFIDTHIHGSDGADVMDGDIEALNTIGCSLRKQGVSGFLATTMTQSDENITKALHAVRQYVDADGGFDKSKKHAEILGVHLEGPFISPNKIGAQNPNYLQEVSFEKLERWQSISQGALKKVTFAPEIADANELVKWCAKRRIISSIGHTNCTASQAQEMLDLGASQATHLFNAMSGIHHRNPGAATALLASKKVLAELIVDQVHLADETVKMVYEIKGQDNILLITDAMSAQAKGEGVFDLGGQKVVVKGNEARLENGTLAGSVLTMNKALENMHLISKCSFPELVKMTSTNAARSLGLMDRGDIQVGMRADLIVLAHDYQIKKCFFR